MRQTKPDPLHSGFYVFRFHLSQILPWLPIHADNGSPEPVFMPSYSAIGKKRQRCRVLCFAIGTMTGDHISGGVKRRNGENRFSGRIGIFRDHAESAGLDMVQDGNPVGQVHQFSAIGHLHSGIDGHRNLHIAGHPHGGISLKFKDLPARIRHHSRQQAGFTSRKRSFFRSGPLAHGHSERSQLTASRRFPATLSGKIPFSARTDSA